MTKPDPLEDYDGNTIIIPKAGDPIEHPDAMVATRGKKMLVAVAGSRFWPLTASDPVYETLDRYILARGGGKVLVGDAPGVDQIVRRWCALRGVECEVFSANPAEHGKRASPVRSQTMLARGPDLVLAFEWLAGADTRFFANEAKRLGIPGAWIQAKPKAHPPTGPEIDVGVEH